ncbi:MAG: SLC13 family permease [Candidatus Scatomorpha sp.]|jgi:sodium-dependent dicarboxylate transporter 2/3/5
MEQSTIAIIILVAVIIAFASSKISIAVTAILASLPMVIVGILEPSEALSFFGNNVVIMVAGCSVLANAIFETGLASWLGKKMMSIRFIVSSERRFLIAMFLTTTLFSTVMGNVPVLAIMLPIAASVISESGGRIRQKTLYMAMAIASGLGGNVTLAGSSCNMLAQGILQSTSGVEPFGFFTLAPGALPSILSSFLFFSTFGYALQEKVFDYEEDGKNEVTQHESTPLNKSKALITGICFILCIAGFVFQIYSIGTTALLAATICVLTNCISFKTAMQKMDWTTVCVLGGALGFAKGVNVSGAGTVIAENLLSLFGGSNANPHVILAVIVLIGGAFTNVMQNNAVIAILLPIALMMAQKMGVNTLPFAAAVVYSASFACATPIGTAPMTMSLAAGYRFTDYLKIGGLCELFAVIATIIFVPVIYPF